MKLTDLSSSMMEKLETNELVHVMGGLVNAPALPNNSDGKCGGANNSIGLCDTSNNSGGRCMGTNNGSGLCGTLDKM